MGKNIKITFWLNRVKKNSKNLVPVYLRVTQNSDFFNNVKKLKGKDFSPATIIKYKSTQLRL